MILRIVKMEFRPEGVEPFQKTFERFKNEIRSQPGCDLVLLLQDTADERRFFTYSLWESEEALNRYRDSATFKAVWPLTKQWFSAAPEAWSTKVLDGILPLPTP